MDARRLGDIAAELEKIESPDLWLDVDVQSGDQVPAMRQVRHEAEVWLASLDYETEVQRRDNYQRERRERTEEVMPGLDASPAERAAYLAAHQPFEPPTFTRSGDDWSVQITANPRSANARGPGQFTIGLRSAGAAPPGDLRRTAGGRGEPSLQSIPRRVRRALAMLCRRVPFEISRDDAERIATSLVARYWPPDAAQLPWVRSAYPD